MTRLFVSFLTLLFFITAQVTLAQTSRASLEKKKANVEKEIGSLQKELEKTQKNKNATLKEVNALKKKIKEREALIGDYAAQINNIDKGISQTKQQLGSRKDNLKSLQSRYANMVLYNYRHRSAYDRMMFVLASRSFNEAFQRLRYLKRYAEYRRSQTGEIREAIVQLSDKQTQLLATKTKKQKELEAEQNQKAQLAREKQQHDKLMTNMSKQEKKLKADLSNKKKEQSKLNKKIEDAIRKEIAAATKASSGSSASSTKSTGAASKTSTSAALTMTPEAKALSSSFASNQGKFPWPVEKGNISEGFGTHAHAELKGVTTKNNGVDIKTTAGAAVRSVFKGKVVSIVNNPLYHKGVIIRHGEYFTVYTNLETVNVKVGDEVSTKQTIGTVHTDAETKQATVHFEVWKGTVFMNPQNWLAAK